jgi:CheY-like chemotaxis protein
MNWEMLYYFFGALALVATGVVGALKWRSSAKVETFKAIMEESRVFREEIRKDLDDAKKQLEGAKREVESLKEKVKEYLEKIEQLEAQLHEALKPRNWIYYYLQKPLKRNEIETIVARHIMVNEDPILVVDDDPFTQRMFDNLVDLHGWNVLRATTGSKALDMLKLHKPKMIFMDLVLPVTDGFEVLNAIHDDKSLTGIPMIIISGSTLKEVDRIFIHTKINESLIKA